MGFKTGDVGESWVQLWATQGGITANLVQRDEFGWDFCLQLRRDPGDSGVGHLPIDELAPELTCFVQVKTTLAGTTDEDVKLSNWERMVKDPYPWFFIRIALDGEGEPERVYLIHIGEAWMERVLRRLREHPQDRPTQLHRHTLSLHWEETEALVRPFGPSLRSMINERVGNLSKYVQQKAALLGTLGYDKARHRIQVRVPIADEHEHLERRVDFAIGIVDTLPISALSFSEVRFNMPRLIEEREHIDGVMKITSLPSIGDRQLRFGDALLTDEVTMTFKTYVPTTLFPDTPEEYFKIRYVAPLVSVVMKPKMAELYLEWHLPDDSESLNLAELVIVSRLATLCSAASATNPFIIACPNGREWVDIAQHKEAIPIPAEMRQLAVAAQNASFLAKYFELPPVVGVRIEHLLDQEGQLMAMRGTLDRAAGTISIQIGFTADAACDGKRVAIVVPMSVRIADCALVAICAHVGTAQWNERENKVALTRSDILLLAKWIVPLEDWSSFPLAERILAASHKLDDLSEYEIVFNPDAASIESAS